MGGIPMKRLAGVILFTLLLALSSAAKDKSSDPTLEVKFGSTPVLDGKVGDEEWDDAVKITMSNGKAAYLKHDNDTLYVAFEGGKLLGSVCVAVNDEVHVLHSSGSLGTAVYKRTGDGRKWKLSKGFGAWSRCLDSMWKSSGWKASFQGKEILEYAVSFKLLGLDRAGDEKLKAPVVRAALVYFSPPQPVVWPKRLRNDGSSEMMLIMGGPPDSITFDLDKWAMLGSESAWLVPVGENSERKVDP
jgi:hypothetical protein